MGGSVWEKRYREYLKRCVPFKLPEKGKYYPSRKHWVRATGSKGGPATQQQCDDGAEKTSPSPWLRNVALPVAPGCWTNNPPREKHEETYRQKAI